MAVTSLMDARDTETYHRSPGRDMPMVKRNMAVPIRLIGVDLLEDEG
jgi:hypothetical protein